MSRDYSDDSLNLSWSDWRDDEREVQARTRRRIMLDARGTLRQRFEPDAPVATADALSSLRKAGLL